MEGFQFVWDADFFVISIDILKFDGGQSVSQIVLIPWILGPILLISFWLQFIIIQQASNFSFLINMLHKAIHNICTLVTQLCFSPFAHLLYMWCFWLTAAI
jgi:hypothetical protein